MTVLFLPFQFECLLFFFPVLIVVVRNSNKIFNKTGENGHPCLLPDLRGKALNFFIIEYEIICRFFIYGLYYLRVQSLYTFKTNVSLLIFCLDNTSITVSQMLKFLTIIALLSISHFYLLIYVYAFGCSYVRCIKIYKCCILLLT